MVIQVDLWWQACKLCMSLVLTFIVFSGGDGRFEVDRKNGQVRTTGLPLQQDREYLLTVVAADQLGSRSIPAVLSVVAGSRPPQFSNASFTISIPENTPAGQPWVYRTHGNWNFTNPHECICLLLLADIFTPLQRWTQFTCAHAFSAGCGSASMSLTSTHWFSSTEYATFSVMVLNFQYFFHLLFMPERQQYTSNAFSLSFYKK